MDPFEEFEFKPLTDGLGFHRREVPKKDSQKPPLPRATVQKDLLFQAPLSRTKKNSDSAIAVASSLSPSAAAVEDILKKLGPAPQIQTDISTKQDKPSLSQKTLEDEYDPDVINFTAFFLDSLLVLATGLLCMILMLAITKVDLIRNISHPDQQGQIYLSTFMVFFGVTFIYYTLNRAFLGYTPGEWAYDQRLGTPDQIYDLSYIPKCLLRWAIIVATGFVVLPLISKIMDRDLVGDWIGLPLMRKI